MCSRGIADDDAGGGGGGGGEGGKRRPFRAKAPSASSLSDYRYPLGMELPYLTRQDLSFEILNHGRSFDWGDWIESYSRTARHCAMVRNAFTSTTAVYHSLACGLGFKTNPDAQ